MRRFLDARAERAAGVTERQRPPKAAGTRASAANATTESGVEAEPRVGSGVVADGPRCVVYGALAGRLTAERTREQRISAEACRLALTDAWQGCRIPEKAGVARGGLARGGVQRRPPTALLIQRTGLGTQKEGTLGDGHRRGVDSFSFDRAQDLFRPRSLGGTLDPSDDEFHLACGFDNAVPPAFGLLAIGLGGDELFQAVRRAFVDQAGVVKQSEYFMRGEDVGHLVLAMVFRSNFELSGYFELSDRFRGPPSPGFGWVLVLSGNRWL